MKITLQTTTDTDTRHRHLAKELETSLSDVYRRALSVYELLQDAEEITVIKGGETKTLLLPLYESAPPTAPSKIESCDHLIGYFCPCDEVAFRSSSDKDDTSLVDHIRIDDGKAFAYCPLCGTKLCVI